MTILLPINLPCGFEREDIKWITKWRFDFLLLSIIHKRCHKYFEKQWSHSKSAIVCLDIGEVRGMPAFERFWVLVFGFQYQMIFVKNRFISIIRRQDRIPLGNAGMGFEKTSTINFCERHDSSFVRGFKRDEIIVTIVPSLSFHTIVLNTSIFQMTSFHDRTIGSERESPSHKCCFFLLMPSTDHKKSLSNNQVLPSLNG